MHNFVPIWGETSVPLQCTILSLWGLLGEFSVPLFCPYILYPTYTVYVSVIRWERTVLLALYVYYCSESLQYKKALRKSGLTKDEISFSHNKYYVLKCDMTYSRYIYMQLSGIEMSYTRPVAGRHVTVRY